MTCKHKRVEYFDHEDHWSCCNPRCDQVFIPKPEAPAEFRCFNDKCKGRECGLKYLSPEDSKRKCPEGKDGCEICDRLFAYIEKCNEEREKKCLCAHSWLLHHTWHVPGCPMHTAENCPYPCHNPKYAKCNPHKDPDAEPEGKDGYSRCKKCGMGFPQEFWPHYIAHIWRCPCMPEDRKEPEGNHVFTKSSSCDKCGTALLDCIWKSCEPYTNRK